MSFRINTNVAALNSYVAAEMNNIQMSNSLETLSTGLRINKAADDASGMAIADTLRAAALGLGQSIQNANNGIALTQIADKAMDEQIKILYTIKTKAIQAAQNGQTTQTREAIQEDISKMLNELDNIAATTSFNGQKLLSGQFTNKEFQIGAYSNTVIKASIGATSSDKIGATRFETGQVITGAVSAVALKFMSVDGVNDIQLESVAVSHSAGTGIGVLAEVINKNSNETGVRASWQVQETASAAVKSGNISGLVINGVNIGDITDIEANDKDGKLVNAINSVEDQTGVKAFIDNRGNLNLVSDDGRGIQISGVGIASVAGFSANQEATYGRLTLTRLDARDIILSGQGLSGAGFNDNSKVAQFTANLRMLKGIFNSDQASAIGANPNSNVENAGKGLSAGVTTLPGAMAVMEMAESAQKMLDEIRGGLGAVENQFVSTLNNISVTQVNIKAAESQIRDVDFAKESANFNKYNLLAKSGAYAMMQANLIEQQDVMVLLK